jgi:hypothetical protein
MSRTAARSQSVGGRQRMHVLRLPSIIWKLRELQAVSSIALPQVAALGDVGTRKLAAVLSV